MSAGSDRIGRLGAREYDELVARIRQVVAEAVPAGATVVVVSKGDDRLLQLGGRQAWHFPQMSDGTYAGHYPADSAGAIAQLEAVRAKGGRYLLFPRTALWWLDYYTDFRQHLESRYQTVVDRNDACRIFALGEAEVRAPGPAPDKRSAGEHELADRVRAIVRDVLPPDAGLVLATVGESRTWAMEGRRTWTVQVMDGSGRFAPDGEVVAMLDDARRDGASFLVVPLSAFCWLERARDLLRRFPLVARQDHSCFIYELTRERGA